MPATSEVQICSNALLLLGAQTINSFDDDNDRALLVANLWPNTLEAVLRSHPWNCAIKRVALAPDAVAPAFEWAYAFTLPGDCLRLLSIGERGEYPEFELEGRKILFDEAELKLRYVYKNEDIPSWDALLVQAAEAYMAMTCAYPITKSASMFEAMTRLWDLKLRQARTIDGLENPPEQLGDFPLLNARR
jgi:hypothetical protein